MTLGLAVLALASAGCKRGNGAPLHDIANVAPGIRTSADPSDAPSIYSLSGKRVSCLAGSSFSKKLIERVPDVHIVYHKSLPDQILALETGRIDAFAIDEPIWRILRHNHPFFRRCKEIINQVKHGIIVDPKRPELHNRLSAFIASLRASGELDRLQRKWTSSDPADHVMPPPPEKGRAGILRVATVTTLAPFSYLQDGRIVGYEIEILSRFAEQEGYGLDMMDIYFESVLIAVSTGKASIGAAAIIITPERAKAVLFAEPDYVGGTAVIVNTRVTPLASGSVFQRFSDSFHKTFLVEHRYLKILRGLGVTFLITLCSCLFGTLLGIAVCALLRSSRMAAALTGLLVHIIQGTPVVVVLLVMYYIVFGAFEISAVAVAVLTFSITFSAEFAMLLRGALKAVDPGQIEAALAMGFTRAQVYRYIDIPQALHAMLPNYASAAIGLLKESAIVGYIAIEDLTSVSDDITASTYEAFFPLVSTAIIYLLAAYCVVTLFGILARRLDPLRRPRVIQAKN